VNAQMIKLVVSIAASIPVAIAVSWVGLALLGF
jgi:hypothetical protein